MKQADRQLIAAIKAKDLDSVKYWVEEKNANVNVTTKNNWGEKSLPLHIAIEESNAKRVPKIVRYLLEKGADIELDVSEAGWDKNNKLIERYGATAIVEAVRLGKTSSVKELLKHKPNLSVIFTGNGGCAESLLHIAARNEYLSITNLLINAGVDINANSEAFKKTPYSETPLVTALTFACKKVAIRLIEAGADISFNDSQGSNLLFYTQEPVLLETLIQAGLDVNAMNHSGKTPLHSCTDVEAIRLLLANGANYNIQDEAGFNPVEYAIIHVANQISRFGSKLDACYSHPLIEVLLTNQDAVFELDKVISHVKIEHEKNCRINPHLFKKKQLSSMIKFINDLHEKHDALHTKKKGSSAAKSASTAKASTTRKRKKKEPSTQSSLSSNSIWSRRLRPRKRDNNSDMENTKKPR